MIQPFDKAFSVALKTLSAIKDNSAYIGEMILPISAINVMEAL